MELGEAVAGAGIKKQYYLETRGDVFLRNKGGVPLLEDARRRLHLPRLEAIDEEGLLKYRKRVPLGAISRPSNSPARSASSSPST